MSRRRTSTILLLLAGLTIAVGVVAYMRISRKNEAGGARVVEAEALLAKGQVAEARKLLESSLAQHPDDAATSLALAKLLSGSGDSVGAQRALEKSLKIHPENAAINETLANMVMQSLGEIAYPKIQPMFEIALKNEPQRCSAAISLSRIYAAKNQLTDAAVVVEKALAFNPRNAAAHLQLAKILALQHKYDLASRQFDAATALDPANAEGFFTWGVMLLDDGKPQAAETVLRKALEINGSSAAYHMHLGRALRDQGKMDTAMNEFQAALNKDKLYAPVYLEIASTLLRVHNEAGAERFLNDALVVNGQFAEAKVLLAKLLTKPSDPSRRNLYKAADLLRQAAEDTKGQDLSVLVGCADALAQVEAFDQATDQIDKAILLADRQQLAPVQHELLVRCRQSYYLSSLSPSPSDQPNVNFLSIDGLRIYDPLDQPWPRPPQLPVELVTDNSIDLAYRPGKGTVLDPELYRAWNLSHKHSQQGIRP